MPKFVAPSQEELHARGIGVETPAPVAAEQPKAPAAKKAVAAKKTAAKKTAAKG